MIAHSLSVSSVAIDWVARYPNERLGSSDLNDPDRKSAVAEWVSTKSRCEVDGEAKPFLCNATVLEPKQVIDFVQLAPLVIRVGIS